MVPSWHPHFDVWAVVAVLGLGYWYANARIRPHISPKPSGPKATQQWQWYGGLLLLLVVSGWPLHDIGETSLFTVHMIEHMVLALVVPPLLLMGIPGWIADRTLGHPRVAKLVQPLARPAIAFAIFNLGFILIHWPDLVGWMLTYDIVHFAVHAGLMIAATLMWLPVLSPSRAIPKLTRPGQMLYLLLQSLLPTVPASFLTFSTVPIYPIYGNAAEAYGLTALADQTIAGIIMKLGGGFILWITIAVIWFRWTSREKEWEKLESSFSVS